MITVIKFLLNKVPAHWWRTMARAILTSAFTFYLLSLSEFGLVDRYLSIFIRSLFWKYTFLYLLNYFIFYYVLDCLLRFLAFKIVRDKIIAGIAKESKESRIEFLRGVNEIKNGAMNFVMGYPVGLGYVSTSDLREIGNSEPIVANPEEKEKAINEIITALNKWACVLIHLVFTLLLVWKYDKVLVLSIFVAGFILTIFLYIGIIFMVQHLDSIATLIQKEFRKRF